MVKPHLTSPKGRNYERQKISDMESIKQKILRILETVHDPEIPVLSVVDLGIVRDVTVKVSPIGGEVEGAVFITPTYTGCPAMDVIRTNIRLALIEHGYPNLTIKTILSPAWTTEWMSE